MLGALRWIWKWYGYLLLAGLLIGWGAVPFDIKFVMLTVALTYFMLQVPSVCGAVTRRNQYCRNNARGVMMGCHIREHKWQKWRLAVVPRSWRRLTEWLGRQPKLPLLGGAAAAVAALGTAIQAVAAVMWHP